MQSNLGDKTFGHLNHNSVPTNLLFNLSDDRYSGSSVQAPNKGKASEHLVPFLLKIFDLKETTLTKSIHSCVIELDNLAIHVDSLIDLEATQSNWVLSRDKYDYLESKVVDCFSSLSGAPGLGELISFTLEYVNISYFLNTYERHLIYNFEEGVSCSRCTTMYLFPLIHYLYTQRKTSVGKNRFFILIANYIQLLDDFIDVFDDINSEIATPVTERFIKIINNIHPMDTSISSFEALVINVRQKLEDYLKAIEQEIQEIRGIANSEEIVRDWRKFHYEFDSIPIIASNNYSEQRIYLRNIHEIIPPILCYAG